MLVADPSAETDKQARTLLIDALRFHEGTVARSPTSAAMMIWNALQCGKKLQELACLARDIGRPFDILVEEGRGNASVRHLKRHLALYRKMTDLSSFKQVLDSGFKSLHAAQLAAGVVQEKPLAITDEEAEALEDKRIITDVAFCRLAGNGGNHILRVSSIGKPGEKHVAGRHEVSLETPDPQEARKIRDIVFNYMEKVGSMAVRTAEKIADYREAGLEPTPVKGEYVRFDAVTETVDCACEDCACREPLLQELQMLERI